MNRAKYQLGDYQLIRYQILQIDIIRNVWQIVRRITREILGVKGLTNRFYNSTLLGYSTCTPSTIRGRGQKV